jgi:hypothetical protein
MTKKEMSESKIVVNGPTDFSELQESPSANAKINGNFSSIPIEGSKKRSLPDSNEIPAKQARNSINQDSDSLTKNGGCTPLADRFNDGVSNCSSTVDDMRRIMIGNNQIYPLTIEMEQRMILQFLQSVCEFTDVSFLHKKSKISFSI